MKKKLASYCAWYHAHSYTVYNCALAYTATPYADTVFSSARVLLSTQMDASFTAQTKSKQAEIKVTSCILQIKTGSVWVDSMDLNSAIQSCDKYKPLFCSEGLFQQLLFGKYVPY